MKHTSGPWHWINRPDGHWWLGTLDRGMLVVMDFTRKGMNDAQPRFAVWEGENRERLGGLMKAADKLEVSQHPDAQLIALAPEMARLVSEMRCLYKAPEVANEMCGHCTVCKVKQLS